MTTTGTCCEQCYQEKNSGVDWYCFNENCPCHTENSPKSLSDCSGCTDRNSEGTHQMHTIQHPCKEGGNPDCGYCFPENSSTRTLEEEFDKFRDSKGGWPSRTECFEEFFVPKLKEVESQARTEGYHDGFKQGKFDGTIEGKAEGERIGREKERVVVMFDKAAQCSSLHRAHPENEWEKGWNAATEAMLKYLPQPALKELQAAQSSE